MINKIILATLLICTSIFAEVNLLKKHIPFGVDSSSCDMILERSSYVSCYNFDKKNPSWVSYTITKELAAKYLPRKNRFSVDKEVPISHRSNLKDYKKSGYDRGHMFPNALADYSRKSQQESFLLSNITPQLPGFNRAAFKHLEGKVRDFLKKGNKINVVTGAIYNQNHKRIGNKVAVPDYFYKIIYSFDEKRFYSYLMPHRKMKDFEYKKYATSINNIEEKTNTIFFVNIDNKDLKEEVNRFWI